MYDVRTAKITIGTGLTGKYYLFIRRISDNLGHDSEAELIDPTSFTQENEMLDSFGNPKTTLNGQIVQNGTESYHLFGRYIFDNSNPYLDVQHESTVNENADDGKAVKHLDMYIEIQDIGLSGLSSNNSYQYYLSTSNEKAVNGEWINMNMWRDPQYENDFRPGTFSLERGLTGTYYIFIKAVSDNLGHVSNATGTMKTVKDANGNDVLCHMYGPYVFDNSQPEIEFESINPENESEWAKSHTEQVTVTDVGTAGVNEDTLRFVWIKGNEVPTEITDFTQTFVNGQTISIAAGTGNDYYLWIYADDNTSTIELNADGTIKLDEEGNPKYKPGNPIIKTTNPFWLDNTAPVIENLMKKPTSPTTYSITATGVVDNGDGITPQSGVKGYYYTYTPGGEPIENIASITPTEQSEWIPNSNDTMEISGIPELTTYYFWTIDNVGNISEPIIISTGEIFYSINDTSWYETFAEAVADADESGDTIYVLKDVTDSSDGTVNKNVKLDTRGKVLTRTTPIIVAPGFMLEAVETGVGTGMITSNSTTEPTIKAIGINNPGNENDKSGIFKLTSGTVSSKGYTPLIADNYIGIVWIAGGNVKMTPIESEDEVVEVKAVVAGKSHGMIIMTGGTIDGNVYTGNEGAIQLQGGTINGNLHVADINGNIEYGAIILTGATVNGNIYGGGDGNVKTEESVIALVSGKVKNVFGGGINGATVERSEVELWDGMDVAGNLEIESGNIYGGPNGLGTVNNSNIYLLDGTINNVYAGGTQGGTTINSTINMTKGETKLGTTYQGVTVTGNIYGGSNNAVSGNKTNNSGSTTINIIGGTIEGNIYGGSNSETVYGSTTINIGNVTIPKPPRTNIESSEFGKGEITIGGNIYGGGHLDNTGMEDEEGPKPFTQVQVKNGTHINIDGSQNTINFNGDIFGSGEETLAEGSSSITIKNLGTQGNPYLFRSIQRTNNLTIDNSVLEIIGISDASNLNVDASYTLNRIGELNIQNNTYLYLRRGFNVVGGLNSKAADGSKATVSITDGGVATKNVDNRIYVYEAVNLYIAKEEYSKVDPISEYGKVNGMTYFGMYTRDRENSSLKYDMYDPTTPTYSNTFKVFSYVVGDYVVNYEQTVSTDGFYTNALQDEAVASSPIIYKYIGIEAYPPTYQEWKLGEKVYTQEVTLVAQRNKDRVYQSIPLENLNQAGAEYEVKIFSVNSLEPDIELVPRTSIPRVATTPEIANSTFALTMKNGSGWQNSGETQFYSSGTPIQGTTYYLSDDSEDAPYMDFYLYNSINITQSRDCGFANVVFEVTKTTNGDASEGAKFKIAVLINIQTIGEIIEGEFETAATITEGKEFGLITENEIFITDRSSMTAFFDMYPLGGFDLSEYRVLSSTFALPIGTQITMVDYGEDEYNPKVYYYEVNELKAQEQETGRYIYEFSDFVLMGSKNGTAHYANNNEAYSNSGFEEYKIVIDFNNTTINQNLLQQNIRFELRDGNGVMKNYEIAPTQLNIYKYDESNNSSRSNLALTVVEDISNVHDMLDSGKLTFTVNSIMTTKSVSIQSTYVDEDGNTKTQTIVNPIEDTFFDDKKLGMAISLYDSEGNKVPYEKVKGIYYNIDGQEYYPDLTGSVRYYLADNVVTVSKKVEMFIEGSLLDSGTYQVRIENFASDNGTYFKILDYTVNQDGTETGVTNHEELGYNYSDIQIDMIDLSHGLSVDIADGDRVIDSTTGKTHLGTPDMNMIIKASDIVENANIRVTLYKRGSTYDENLNYADITYSLQDLEDYVSTTLAKPESVGLTSSNENEYLVTNSVGEQTDIDWVLTLEEALSTGGYKLRFGIYSGDTCLGTVERHFVVTDLLEFQAVNE